MAETAAAQAEFDGFRGGLRRLLLVDDHPLFRAALKGAIANLYPEAVVEEATTLGSAKARAEVEHGIDLVVLDLTLPDSTGLSGLMTLRAQFPELAVVVISATEDADTVRRALSLGASGFIPKSASAKEIGDAFEAVLAGETWSPPQSRPWKRRTEAAHHNLTPAQVRMLMALRAGSPNKQIAFEMGVTESTVKCHMSALFRKLGVYNRTQALLVAQTFGVLDS